MDPEPLVRWGSGDENACPLKLDRFAFWVTIIMENDGLRNEGDGEVISRELIAMFPDKIFSQKYRNFCWKISREKPQQVGSLCRL